MSLVNLFLRKGWIATKEGPEGKTVIDRSRSKVRLNSLHIYINLRGREPDGIVPQEEYEDLRNQILHELRHLRDLVDGEPAIELALKKKDAGIMGMWGDAIGDIIFCYAPGHAWTGSEVLGMGEDRVIFESGGANHGPQPPWTETEVSSNYATLILKGPGVKSGHVQKGSDPGAVMVDFTPTLCHLVGIPAPRDSEGRILRELLEGRPPAPKRPPRPEIEFPELPPSRGPPKFKGDVTDEI